MQYVQVVMLDFFPRRDGLPGRISWPHVSINTLTKVSDEVATNEELATTRPRRPPPDWRTGRAPVRHRHVV